MPYLSHADIRDRFHNDLGNILRFADFLNSAVGLDRLSLHRVNSNLRTLGFDHLRLPAGGLTAPIDPEDLATMAPRIAAIEQLLPEIFHTYDAVDDHNGGFVQSEVTGANEEEAAKWAEYVTSIVPAKYDAGTADLLKEKVRKKIESEGAVNWLHDTELVLFINDVVQTGLGVIRHFRREAAYELLDQVEHLKFLATFSNTDAEMNALRQSFILLMTTFDAAIFDMMRAALSTNFFPLISYFGKDAKVALGDLGGFTTIDEFVDFVTEAQLKKRYLKDLIQLLNEFGVPLVDVKTHTLVQLFEIVLRRNLHVHNRGIVDQFYLDEGKNIHKLIKGQVAAIDEPYWSNAVDICRHCMDEVVDWIQKGALVPKRPL